jgi:hypothetical protein
MTIQEIMPRRLVARELLGDYWFNGAPVLLGDHHGQVVLVFFWDFSSSASVRALPYVQDWATKYAPMGLLVVGVHSPRFRFGQDPENVQHAIKRLGVRFPVVSDNSQMIWSLYGNRTWPSLHLVDKDGYIRSQSFGDGSYLSFERSVQSLLSGHYAGEELPDLTEPFHETDRPGVICYRATPEILGGYLRGSVGNVEGMAPESVLEYADPGVYVDGRMYLRGVWLNDRECFRWEGEAGTDGAVMIRYHGIEANLVLGPPEGGRGTVCIEQDGVPLTVAEAGSDVTIGPGKTSSIVLDSARLYNIVHNREFGEHLLTLRPQAPGCAVYSLTGVAGVIPDVISSN